MCVEKLPNKIDSDFLRIGNYAITFFASIVTGSLAIGNITVGPENYPIAIPFALYTILSAFVAYCHRLAWLRKRNAQKLRGETQTDLSFWAVFTALFFHAVLIVALGFYLFTIQAF